MPEIDLFFISFILFLVLDILLHIIFNFLMNFRIHVSKAYIGKIHPMGLLVHRLYKYFLDIYVMR